jgi:uncharacterized protein YjiS (DUF1127 family)
MSSTALHPTATSAQSAAGRLVGQSLLVRLVVGWFNMRAKQRSRHQLGALDARLLRDIGLDRATALEEARRSVWQ